MDCLQPCSVKIGSRLVLHPLSSTGHLSIHCQKLKSCSSQQIRKPTVLSSNRPRLWMAKQVALTECGNLMHMCAASSSHSTRCASNAAPAQHNSGTLKSEAQAMELKAGSQADTVPHRRQGVPVYVMLPLDTVSLRLMSYQRLHDRPVAAQVDKVGIAGQQPRSVSVRVHILVCQSTWLVASFWR